MRTLLCLCLLVSGCAAPAAPASQDTSDTPPISGCTANEGDCDEADQRIAIDFTASSAQPFTWSFWFAGGNLSLTVSTQVTAYAGLEIGGDASCRSPAGMVTVLGTSAMGIACGHAAAGNKTLTLTPTGVAQGTITVYSARAV